MISSKENIASTHYLVFLMSYIQPWSNYKISTAHFVSSNSTTLIKVCMLN